MNKEEELLKYITYLSHKIVKEVNECDNNYDAREEVELILQNSACMLKSWFLKNNEIDLKPDPNQLSLFNEDYDEYQADAAINMMKDEHNTDQYK